jgi:hypothetical protein
MVYDAVHDSYPCRLKTVGGVVRHIDEILRIISRGFQKHVPGSGGAVRQSSRRRQALQFRRIRDSRCALKFRTYAAAAAQASS